MCARLFGYALDTSWTWVPQHSTQIPMIKNRIPSAAEIAALIEAKSRGGVVQGGVLVDTAKLVGENLVLSKANEKLEAAYREEQEKKLSLTAKDRRGLFDALLLKYGVEPAEEILKMLTDSENPHYISDPQTRLDTWQKLMEYRTPKLKSVEHEGATDNVYNIVVVRYGDDGKAVQEKAPERMATPIDVEVSRA